MSRGLQAYLEQVFDAETVNFYGASESLALGVQFGREDSMVLFDDLNYVELIDGEFFGDIHDKFGKMDLVIMENGQYNKRWSDCHMMPEEGVQAALDLEAEWVLPVHWAGFVLATHKWSEPAQRYTQAAEKTGVNVVTPEIGETVNESQAAEYQKKWWMSVS